MTVNGRGFKVAGVLMLGAVIAFSSGCNKQFTNLKLNKAKSLLAEAAKYNGDKHAKAEYDRSAQLINQTEQAAAGGDFKGAKAVATQAVTASRDVLAAAKRMEATARKNAADHEVKIMNDNNGARENQELYQQILQLQQTMQQRYDKEKWVTVIELADEIKQKVEQLLMRLRGQADADLVEVKAEYKRLLDEGGRDHALTYVTRVEELIKQIEETIDPNRVPPIKNYLRAMALAKQAMRDAGDGITESKRKKCEGEIEEIYGKLVQAKEKRAEYFLPELWNACSDDFSKLIDNFWKKEYDFVLGASSRLKGQVDTLIYETRKASANFQLEKLAQRLAELRSKAVPQYLPGRIDPLDASFQNAQGLFQQEKFEEVEAVCKTAQINADEIMKEFRGMADGQIREARAIAQRAAAVFKEMERIFEAVPLQNISPLDQTFEQNKQALKTDLGRRLAEAQSNVALAEVKHTAEEYRDAIELSKSVQDEGTSILATVYNVVAYNVISEIADAVTRYDREGAPEKAAAEMALTKKLLEEAKRLRDQNEPQAAAAKAAEARAELERTIQTIEVAASQAIEKAAGELKRSDVARTSELRPEEYQRAVQAVNEARLQLQTTRLLDAIQTAERAETIIRQAAQDAARMWAGEALKNASNTLADALRAGADINAPQMLNDAKEDLAQAEKLYASAEELLGQRQFDEARNKYLEAKTLAVQAGEGATRAKFRLIDEAEAAIVEARSYGAWRSQLEQMTEATLMLDQAKEAMAQGRFEQSDRLARKAHESAQKICNASKGEAFRARLQVIEDLLSQVTNTGGRYFDAANLAAMTNAADQLREQYDPRLFDTQSKQVIELETRLQNTLETMPNMVEEWLKRQNARIAQIESGVIPPTFAPRISEAKKFLRFAEIDYKRGRYRTAYTNVLVARRLVDELVTERAESEYRRNVRAIFDDLKQAMTDFDHFLSLPPATLAGLTRSASGDAQFVAIAGRAKPQDFRQRVDQIMVNAQSLQPPPTMREFHDRVMEMINTARASAIHYERLLILGEFDDATKREIITKAWDLMQSVRSRRVELEKALEPRPTDTGRG
ncbi:MAG: DUF4398 domain-containing protein [Candidatus Sumerlaeia bacterium]|nr:DUF4398 domain-containing protein [Candidatus Sumerlaeia bacterium]